MEYILGTAQLGLDYGINNAVGKPSRVEAFNILSCAYDNRLFLDTAGGYGDSEKIIGEYISETGREFSVCSKYSGKGNLAEELQFTLKKLSVDKLYLYYLHKYEDSLDHSIINSLVRLKESGAISRIGISIYTPRELSHIIQNLSSVFDVIQIPFSIVDCSRWVPAIVNAALNNVDIYCRSIFLQGAILKPPNDEFIKSYSASGHLSFINDICNSYKCEIGHLAFSFCQSFKEIAGLIFGCETLDQLNQNILMLKNPVKICENDISLIIDKMKCINSDFIDPRTWMK